MILNRKAISAVDVIDNINEEVKSFRSNSEAVRYFNISEWSIRSYKKSDKLYLNRYIIKQKKSLRSSIGWAELWRCLGYKFESYLRQLFALRLVKLSTLFILSRKITI